MYLPGYIINDVGLEQEIATRKQILCDEVLIRPYSDAVTHTQRAEHIQDLKIEQQGQKCKGTVVGPEYFKYHLTLQTLWLRPCLSSREIMDLM